MNWLSNILKKVTPFGLFVTTVLFLALIFVFMVGLLIAPKNAVLSASAKSQVFSFRLAPEDEIPAFLSDRGNLEYVENCDDPEAKFSISDPIKTPVTVTVSAAPQGGVVAEISPDKQAQFGVVYCDGALIPIDQGIVQQFSEFERDQGVVVVNRGKITIGSVPRQAYSPVLLEGTVTAASPSYPFPSGRATEQAKVSLGESLKFVYHKSEEEAPMQLIARYVPESHFFDIAASAIGDRGMSQELADSAQINRLGNDEPFTVSRVPSIWSRLEAQSEWALLLVLIGVALKFLSALQHYMDTRKD